MLNRDEKNQDLDSKKGLDDFFSDLDDDDETIDGEYDEIDQMIDEVMALLENYGNYSGGLITFNTIIKFLQEKNFPDITKEDCFEIIARLRTNQVILDEIVYEDVPDFYLYIFKEINISSNGKKILKAFLSNPALSLQELKAKTGLDENDLNRIINKFQYQKLIQLEGGKYHIFALNEK